MNNLNAPLSIAIFEICLAAANVAILYLISIIEKEAKKETEMALMQKQIDMQMQSYTALDRFQPSQHPKSIKP